MFWLLLLPPLPYNPALFVALHPQLYARSHPRQWLHPYHPHTFDFFPQKVLLLPQSDQKLLFFLHGPKNATAYPSRRIFHWRRNSREFFHFSYKEFHNARWRHERQTKRL